MNELVAILPDIKGTVLHQLIDLRADLLDHLLAGRIAEDLIDPVYDGLEVTLLQSTGRGCRASDADTARLGGSTVIEGNHILIGRDVSLDQRILCFLTGQLGELLAEIKQHQVVIGTSGDHVIAQLKEGICHGYRIGCLLYTSPSPRDRG